MLRVARTHRHQIPQDKAEANVVAARLELERPHPLSGLRSAYYLCERKSMKDLTRLRRWLIRLVYAKCEWASDYCIHDMGIFTDRDVAEAIARQKSEETGNLWSAKELPVNGLLCSEPVRYGFYSFPTSEADGLYRRHQTRFKAVADTEIQQVAQFKSELEKFAEFVRSG